VKSRVVEVRAADLPELDRAEIAMLSELRVASADLGVANPITLSNGEMLGAAVLDKGEQSF